MHSATKTLKYMYRFQAFKLRVCLCKYGKTLRLHNFIPLWEELLHSIKNTFVNCNKTTQNIITVNQLNLTALKFSVMPMETYFVQENLAFFQELSNGI